MLNVKLNYGKQITRVYGYERTLIEQRPCETIHLKKATNNIYYSKVRSIFHQAVVNCFSFLWFMELT